MEIFWTYVFPGDLRKWKMHVRLAFLKNVDHLSRKANLSCVEPHVLLKGPAGPTYIIGKGSSASARAFCPGHTRQITPVSLPGTPSKIVL